MLTKVLLLGCFVAIAVATTIQKRSYPDDDTVAPPPDYNQQYQGQYYGNVPIGQKGEKGDPGIQGPEGLRGYTGQKVEWSERASENFAYCSTRHFYFF